MTKRATPRMKRQAVTEFYRELARGEKTKTTIYQDLALKHGVESKTIQRWVSSSDKETETTTARLTERLEHLEEGLGMVASGDYYRDEDTGEIKRPEPIPMISQDGRLLV